MNTGFSGYGNSKIANTGADTAPPKAPTGFEIKQLPELNTSGNAKIIFTFNKPEDSLLTLIEAESDDIFSTADVGATAAQMYGANVATIGTVTDLTAFLSTADIIQFGSDTTKYRISSISASEIVLTYGLANAIAPSTTIKKCAKTAEAPSTSRTFRVNCFSDSTVKIYHEHNDRITKWTATATVGSFLDKNKILTTVSETNRDFTKDKLYTVDSTPLPIKVGTLAQAGQKAVIFDQTIMGIIIPNDYLSFGTDETFYQVDSITGLNSLLLKTNLSQALAVGTQGYKKVLLAGDPPVTYVFDGYDTEATQYFECLMTLDDLAGYKIFMKETTQTQESKGTLAVQFLTNDSKLTKYSDGSCDYEFNAPDDSYNGREMYFGLTAYDNAMPTSNESDGDLNAYAVSIPSRVNITNITVDEDTMSSMITYDAVTTNGKNPHLLEMMGDNINQYSTNGGFDLYKKELTVLDMGKGYYAGIDANNGKLIHPDILAGDFVQVRDTVSRHIWVSKAIVNGSCDLNDTVKTYGDAGVSYLSGHLSINVDAKRCAIDKNTDSVLPLGGETKQYLTEKQNTHTVTNLDDNKEYIFVMESVDTQISYSKI